jgi:hypothetical protein
VTSAQVSGQWYASRRSMSMSGGPQSRYGHCGSEKFLSLLGIDPRHISPYPITITTEISKVSIRFCNLNNYKQIYYYYYYYLFVTGGTL